jgi:putative ABC transport system permease protein
LLRLLRQISLRQFRTSWGRTCLVVGGIATGLSLIVAIDIINTSVLENFRRTIELIAGPAALEVTLGVGEVGFPETVVDTVRTDPDVAAAVPLVRGTISLADDPAETLQLFGADLTAEEDLSLYRLTLATERRRVLQSLDDPHSILLTVAFASRRGIRIGQIIKLSTPHGVEDFTVQGLLEPEGFARVLGGQLAIMDLPAAQLMLDKEGRVDQVDIVPREGTHLDTVRQRLQAALPPSLQIARPEQRSEQYERILSSFQAMLTGLRLLCLVAGVYIIYNTTATGAVQRALVMAGLRLIGADAGRLLRLFMVEALVLGVGGTLLGIPAGIVLARLLTGMVADAMGVIFQLRFPIEALAVSARGLNGRSITAACSPPTSPHAG